MWTIGDIPPRGVNESCMQLTEPFDVPVVLPDHRPHACTPNRTSLPSMFPPDCVVDTDWSTPRGASAALPFCSAKVANATKTARMPAITASSTRL